jgi:hypothetical protein
VRPTYEELEEIVALASALMISTRNREREAMKEDYAELAAALRFLHARFPDTEWTASIIDALARAQERAKTHHLMPFFL